MSALLLPQKPEVRPVNFDGIPASLKECPHWVLWRWYYDTEKERWTKPPRQSNGEFARANDPDTWVTFDEVRRAYLDGDFDGVGIVLRDDLVGIDLDHVLDASGELTPLAAEIIDRFRGAYMETSPSGDGLHIYTLGTFLRFGKGTEHKNFECYGESSSRYFTVTGHRLGDEANVIDQQDALDWLYETHFRKPASKIADALPTVADSGAATLLDDLAILADAMRVGNGERFRKLYEYGDFSDYPSQSEADLALANMLARATQDGETLDRLFQASGLYRPEKWNEPHSADGQTYGQMTIAKALTGENSAKHDDLTAISSGTGNATTQSKTPIFHIASLMSNRKPVSWLIQDTLALNSLNQLFGPSGTGKSFVAIDWACAVATGQDWNGYPVECGSVFYIAGEGEDGLGLRIGAQLQRRGVDPSQVPLYVIPEPIALKDGRNAEVLADDIEPHVREHGVPRMIVIDTFARNFGDGDENLASHVNQFIDKIDKHLRRRFGCTVLVVHHSGKGDKGQARGSTALRAAMHFDYSVDESGGRRVLRCHKNKEGPKPPDRMFNLEVEDVQFGDEVVKSAIPVWDDVPAEGKAGKGLTDAERIALKALKDVLEFEGIPPDSNLVDADGMFCPDTVVREDQWKTAAIDAGISTGTKESAATAFRRAKKRLIDAKYVETDGVYYWVK